MYRACELKDQTYKKTRTLHFSDFWAAGFFRGFCHQIFFFVGKVPRNSCRKIPGKILQNLYSKNLRHISAEGPGQKRVKTESKRPWPRIPRYRETISAIPPLLRAMGFLGSQHGQLGAIPPPPLLSVSPWRACKVEGRYPPIKRGISAILAQYPMITRQMGAIPPSAILSRKGHARYGRVSRIGPLRLTQKRPCFSLRNFQLFSNG